MQKLGNARELEHEAEKYVKEAPFVWCRLGTNQYGFDEIYTYLIFIYSLYFISIT